MAFSDQRRTLGRGLGQSTFRGLERLENPLLTIAGAEDTGGVLAAIHFLSTIKESKRPCEMFVYPIEDHSHGQPLFNEEKNYNTESMRTTWVIVEDFIDSHLGP
jgi:dipeptidyl aminopeptidase/acylaminoacyl peptidase